MKVFPGPLILIKIRVNSFGNPDILGTFSVRYFTLAASSVSTKVSVRNCEIKYAPGGVVQSKYRNLRVHF